MKKKILAGVLAAASALSMSVSAFAADDTQSVTGNGELEYDVEVTAPTVVLNLVMPAKLEAALNPYGADIVILKGETDDANVTSSNGIVSTAYKITNKSKDYGVYIDATAVTKPSKGITVTGATLGTTEGKDACMALAGLSKAPTKTAGFTVAASTAATQSAQGTLLLDSTADGGKTEQKKFMYLAAAGDDSDTEAYMGFVGTLESGDDIEWTEDDNINVNLVLKISAGPKKFPGA